MQKDELRELQLQHLNGCGTYRSLHLSACTVAVGKKKNSIGKDEMTVENGVCLSAHCHKRFVADKMSKSIPEPV